MNTDQFLRELKRRHGILKEPKKGTGHVTLINPANGKKTVAPMHGGRKQLGTGLMEKIKKDLGLM